MTGVVNDDPYREFEEALTDVLIEMRTISRDAPGGRTHAQPLTRTTIAISKRSIGRS